MRQILCDRCKKIIEAPKHVFTIEGRDRDAPREYRSPGNATITAELCVDCHDQIRQFIKKGKELPNAVGTE